MRGRERISGIPVVSQEEALSTGKARGTPGWCHHSQSPPESLSIPGKPVFLHYLDFQAKDRLTPRWHMEQPCGKASWESLVGKPCGKASWESHRSLERRDRKGDTAATAREESARACSHSRRGLTPLWRLQKYPKIHGSTGEETSGSGLDSTQGLRPRASTGEESREAP